MTIRFQDGILSLVQPGLELRLQWMPQPLAEEKLGGGSWKLTLPVCRLFVPEDCRRRPEHVFRLGFGNEAHADGDDEAWTSFWATIPADYRAMVGRFPSHQWALLALLEKEPAIRDLAAVNPVLAYALANNHEMRGTGSETSAFQAIRYSHGKQRAILGFLGFPTTDAMVNLFKKIPPESANPTVLRMLRIVLAEGQAPLKLLSHLSAISAGALVLATEPKLEGVVTPDLIAEVAACEAERFEAQAVTMLLDIHRMREAIDPNRPAAPIHSLERLHALHDEVLLELQAAEARRAHEARRAAKEARKRAKEARKRTDALREQQLVREMEERNKLREMFPEPPIPGNQNIVPILSSADLILEGLRQKHCVGAYEVEVKIGLKFLYKMLKPQRATIELLRDNRRSPWRVGQIRLKCNQMPKEATILQVNQWVDAFKAVTLRPASKS
jgi:hypothetical protein